LRTAGPASLACPEAVGALLLQFALAAFAAANGVFCFSFDSKEKRFLPRQISVCVCCSFNAVNGVSLLLSLMQREKSLVRSSFTANFRLPISFFNDLWCYGNLLCGFKFAAAGNPLRRINKTTG